VIVRTLTCVNDRPGEEKHGWQGAKANQEEKEACALRIAF
jgi:hypothetical protein